MTNIQQLDLTLRNSCYKWTILCLCLPYISDPLQTDEERQQALQAFTAQSFLSSPQQNTISGSGSGVSAPTFPSPTTSSEHKAKGKRGPRKNQNEKYRLKYLRLRKAARAMIFVSKWCFHKNKQSYIMHINSPATLVGTPDYLIMQISQSHGNNWVHLGM